MHPSVILFTGRGVPGQVAPLAGTPPRAGTPPKGRYLPGRYPPRQVHPPGQVHTPARYTPQEQCMLGGMGNKRVECILLECILVIRIKFVTTFSTTVFIRPLVIYNFLNKTKHSKISQEKVTINCHDHHHRDGHHRCYLIQITKNLIIRIVIIIITIISIIIRRRRRRRIFIISSAVILLLILLIIIKRYIVQQVGAE